MNKFDGKRILIWGYGREGKSTEDFLKRCAKPASIEVFQGSRDEIDEEKYDFIFKSPGIIMEEDNPKYTSQTQVFLETYRDKIIGITGTKGKSTTSSLMYTVLKACTDKDVLLMGNIGLPCLDYYDHINENTIVVFELSCHQLAHTTVSPHISIFLNLYQDHLDYYGTMEKYFTAKSHVATYQNKEDYFYVGSNVPSIETKASVQIMSQPEGMPYELQIEGLHNQYNADIVYKIASELYDCKDEEIRKSLSTFTGLAHRLQKIAVINGVEYYDDSISTIPQATISAANSLKNAQTLLIGGMDRGIDYSILIEFIKNHDEYQYICMYESGKRIFSQIGECSYIHYVDDLRSAVTKAKAITEPGKACILSPAAASYGYFKNFEERGDVFREFVNSES